MQKQSKPLSIGGFAQQGGVHVETIRFYQKKGLLSTPPKIGKIRRYGQEDLQHLRFILNAKKAGFTLAEIKELLALNQTNDRTSVRKIASLRITELDKKIKELKQAQHALKELVTQCQNDETQEKSSPCPILQCFDTENKKEPPSH